MTESHAPSPPLPVDKPTPQCDVVMKGGITSGVVYPKALVALGRTYRLRGLGGASAGAIGAALGAAAEHGRATGAFDRLGKLPSELGDGRLMALFQARRPTRPMLRLMLAATSARGSKLGSVVRAALRSFPIACIVGIAPGVAIIAVATQESGATSWLLGALGVLTAVVGLLAAVLFRVYRVLTREVTANNFGICTGRRVDGTQPGFTEWLSDKIDELAGTTADHPLTFGQLWTGTDVAAAVAPADRDVDLRLVTTCLSESQPFELPTASGRYYYDAEEWALFFPDPVMEHLRTTARTSGDADEDARLAAHRPLLTRLPLSHDMPVIVATRMSLSFPLLISAIPMWTIDRRTDRMVKVWFTDGGLCSNFPVQMFDAALPTRPTFAINLGRFALDSEEQADERQNVRYARNNRSGIAPRVAAIPHTGLGAITGFAGQAFNSARNWSDVAQLDQPGYRDRIVEVLQTKQQGGMNLDMPGPVIDRLADRGEAAANAMIEQFTTARYPNDCTGWDNHRWMRYRATLAALPDWLASFRRGHAVLAIEPGRTPSIPLDRGEAALATDLSARLVALAESLAASDAADLTGLVSAPRPPTVLRRVPQL